MPGEELVPHTELSKKLIDFILEYQSKIQASCSHSSQVTNDSLDSLYKLQNVLRQSSVLYNAICKSDVVVLCALLLSGNINSTTKEKKPFFTRAFSNSNFVNQSTYLITFLRDNLHFTATLFFKAIESNTIDAKFVSFSTIPTLFQNGWCVEEDLLWSTFLTCYLRQFDLMDQIDPNSKLFFPFKAFFLQKLSLDYLQLALAPDLQSFIDDQDIPSLRVNFEFDAIHMMPKLYINRIQQAAISIIKKLELYLDRVPLSVRRLLTQISASIMKIGFNQYSDISLSNFFFVNCCLVPVITEPHLIGLDAAGSPQFVFDDLANLFFFSNFNNMRFPPPFVFSMTSVLDTKNFDARRLVDSLVNSSNLEPIAEIHESLFQLASDRYQKSVNFMPLDLYYIHKAFVKFSPEISQYCLDENGQKSMTSFDYLMKMNPEVNHEQAFNMFTQQMRLPNPPTPSFVPKKLTSIERCYKTAFTNLSLTQFEIVGPVQAMEFELEKAKRRNETEFAVALQLTLDSYKKDPTQITEFLHSQIESLDKVANVDMDLAIDVKLTYNNIQSLYRRTLQLCTRLTSAAIRMLIHYLIKNHCLQRIAYLDAHKNFYINNIEEFYNLYNSVLQTCAKVIERTAKCDKVDPEMRTKSLNLFKNILYFTLLDRISISSFIENRADLGSIIQTIISEMKWNSDQRVQEAIASAQNMTSTSNVNILMRGVELLIGAVSSSTISMAFHLVLKAISTVVTAVGKCTEKARIGCIMWVIIHSNIELLFYVYKFINHFYGQNIQLVDICGNENVRYWKTFARVFEILAFQRKDRRSSHPIGDQSINKAIHHRLSSLSDNDSCDINDVEQNNQPSNLAPPQTDDQQQKPAKKK
ncbi:hypothetical protein TRFO_10086 [Tritrichomonas foetus]|uniref:Uncharacterized protein n=1 Tax=Tritrichomonas foetus TaxID=1144522 RepID=A0A1J4JFE0_9EUKA|nr:hypothetical protein TRFO_10086 [Tritrichomonas foetus]|eukprot:OHS96173.1 hypothetical protein TRFO_10086 [Tritrichomonas foetus]